MLACGPGAVYSSGGRIVLWWGRIVFSLDYDDFPADTGGAFAICVLLPCFLEDTPLRHAPLTFTSSWHSREPVDVMFLFCLKKLCWLALHATPAPAAMPPE